MLAVFAKLFCNPNFTLDNSVRKYLQQRTKQRLKDGTVRKGEELCVDKFTHFSAFSNLVEYTSLKCIFMILSISSEHEMKTPEVTYKGKHNRKTMYL